ncbi:Carboxypeptidase cpdS [Leucoagaricus sp. SymC.cos]|nr:Carboxypeptidase cpdS [Leucoagaricus sp. SymC.cos]
MALTKISRFLALAFLSCSASVLSQSEPSSPPSSFPHIYPGQPSGDFSPAWQNYFRVKDPLPNVTFPLQQSFAGNIPVQRAGHPNNTLFFIGFEKSKGSLTSQDNHDPWGIWLNGGPGSSSLYGLLFENGPIHINSDYSASPNNHSWTQLADYFWIDQPVGVGFSTADADGYIHDEDQMAADFMGFLDNLVKVFPNLRNRPLHLTGESYAGMYIPYIMKAYFNSPNPPVKIAKFVIGDGTMASGQVFELLPALNIIQTYPQIIGYDQQVFKYFEAQSHLCHYDVNLTYPQNGLLPSIPLINPTQRDLPFFFTQLTSHNFMRTLHRRANERRSELAGRGETELQKRDSSQFLKDRPFDQLDPWYGCILLWMYIDYALNYTFPWTLTQGTDIFGFNVYDVPDVGDPNNIGDGTVFLNDPRVKRALHAPTSKDWAMSFDGVFDGDPNGPEPMTFFSDLATNATNQNIGVVFYSGNNDGTLNQADTLKPCEPYSHCQLLQNTTFGGIQGFSRKPATPWHDDSGNFAGIIHQERNWTYVLFDNSAHTVPSSKPAAAFTFLRDFVLGHNQTGLVINTPNNGITVVGGENSTLAQDYLPGRDEVIYRPTPGGTAVSTYVFPQATRDAWNQFIKTELVRPSAVLKVNNDAGVSRRREVGGGVMVMVMVGPVVVGLVSALF